MDEGFQACCLAQLFRGVRAHHPLPCPKGAFPNWCSSAMKGDKLSTNGEDRSPEAKGCHDSTLAASEVNVDLWVGAGGVYFWFLRIFAHCARGLFAYHFPYSFFLCLFSPQMGSDLASHPDRPSVPRSVATLPATETSLRRPYATARNRKM